MNEHPVLTAGERRLRDIIALLPMTDPRTDIDTASLAARFPHLDGVTVDDLEIVGEATVANVIVRAPRLVNIIVK